MRKISMENLRGAKISVENLKGFEKFSLFSEKHSNRVSRLTKNPAPYWTSICNWTHARTCKWYIDVDGLSWLLIFWYDCDFDLYFLLKYNWWIVYLSSFINPGLLTIDSFLLQKWSNQTKIIMIDSGVKGATITSLFSE